MANDLQGDARRMEQLVRVYIRACNDADAAAIAACFAPDAVHYVPVNDRGHPSSRGPAGIGDAFAGLVKATGRNWTVDQLLTDVAQHVTIMEWTSFPRERDRIVRGVDWFEFDPETLLFRSVRSFTARLSDPEAVRTEQQDFDYAGRGYPTL
jgi:methyltransferase